jgi:alanine racemase
MEIQPNRTPNSSLSVVFEPGNTTVEISKNAFIHNIKTYRAALKDDVKLGVVVKANAYGHGMIAISTIAEQMPHIDMLYTVTTSEALLLRRAGITKPVIVLSFFDRPLHDVLPHNIDLVTVDEHNALRISQAAQQNNTATHIHLKVDTGLSRLGIHYTQAVATILRIARLPLLHIAGIFTHFADSESNDLSFAQLQHARFMDVIEQLRVAGLEIPYQHTSSTAAITSMSGSGNLVRLGLGAYGLWPSVENRVLTRHTIPSFDLQPVLNWKTNIVQIKEIPTGSFIGYDRTHQVQRPTALAILPVGYWDGFDRGLSNCGQVAINNQLAPVLGRVAMNMTMIDVTDIPHISEQTPVTLLGNQQGIRADDIALRLGTINYEVTTRINPHISRVIVP